MIPPVYRLAVVQIVAVAWNSYLTWKANKIWRMIKSSLMMMILNSSVVCDMSRSGLVYLTLLTLLIFPMCKTVTESFMKVGRNVCLLWMTNSHLKVKLAFAEMSVKVCYLWKWDLAVVPQCSHTYAQTHTHTLIY